MNKRSSYLMMVIFIVVIGSFIILKMITSGAIPSAIDDGNVKKIERILKSHPRLVNKKGEFGWTPLYKAAFKGNKEIAELLVSKGADVNAKDPKGSSPLHISASSKDDDKADKTGDNQWDENRPSFALHYMIVPPLARSEITSPVVSNTSSQVPPGPR